MPHNYIMKYFLIEYGAKYTLISELKSRKNLSLLKIPMIDQSVNTEMSCIYFNHTVKVLNSFNLLSFDIMIDFMHMISSKILQQRMKDRQQQSTGEENI